MSGLRLYLLRHAKSSPAGAGMSDFDRPLAESGRAAANAVGQLMARGGHFPTLVLCSTAQRTRETLAGVLAHLPEDMVVQFSRRIYAAGAEELAELLATAGEARRVMVIGHNPAVEGLARGLTRGGDHGLRGSMAAKFAPGALAVIEFDTTDWRQAIAVGGHLVAFETPV